MKEINYMKNVEIRRTLIANRIAEVLELVEHGGIADEREPREGLKETPIRVAKAFETWFSGYAYSEQDVADLLKVFKDGSQDVDEMVCCRNIPIYSHCEHHMAPILGRATVAYIPNGKIVGLSKITRLVEVYARRLQVQERLTTQIAHALSKHLAPKGVAVYIEAEHTCISTRGVKSRSQTTVTNKLVGAFKHNAQTRAEFMAIAREK